MKATKVPWVNRPSRQVTSTAGDLVKLKLCNNGRSSSNIQSFVCCFIHWSIPTSRRRSTTSCQISSQLRARFFLEIGVFMLPTIWRASCSKTSRGGGACVRGIRGMLREEDVSIGRYGTKTRRGK